MISLITFQIILLVTVIKAQSETIHDVSGGSTDVTQSQPIRRIAGGSAVSINKYPFVVEIKIDSFTCAGSILSQYDVLSAAHCYSRYNCPRLTTIYAGSEKSKEGSVHQIKGVVIHNSYSHTKNDIAILHLKNGFQYSDRLSPAFLPNRDYEIPNNTAVTPVGWGASYEGGPMSPLLREVLVYVIDQKTCAERFYRILDYNSITNKMICAGILDVGGKDTCQGDSGGPLVSSDNQVVGITSWGIGCASPDSPGVYTKVSKYIDWIESHMAGDAGTAYKGEYYPENCRAAKSNTTNIDIVLCLVLVFLSIIH